MCRCSLWHCSPWQHTFDHELADAQGKPVGYMQLNPSWGPTLYLLITGISLLIPCILIELAIPAGKAAQVPRADTF